LATGDTDGEGDVGRRAADFCFLRDGRGSSSGVEAFRFVVLGLFWVGVISARGGCDAIVTTTAFARWSRRAILQRCMVRGRKRKSNEFGSRLKTDGFETGVDGVVAKSP
jgi:hypothetical protein